MRKKIKSLIDELCQRKSPLGKILFRIYRSAWKCSVLLRIMRIRPFFNYIGIYRTIDEKKLGQSYLPFYGPTFLKDILEIARQAEIEPFLMCGTLLGCFRDQNLIYGDSDIDLCILESDWFKVNQLKQGMLRKGYPVVCENPFQISFKREELNLGCDFYQFYKAGNQWKITSQNQNKLFSNYYPMDILDQGFMKRRFVGCEVIIPYQTERWLDLTYGDWHTRKGKGEYAVLNRLFEEDLTMTIFNMRR